MISVVRSFAPNYQAPSFELVSAQSAKAIDGMLAVTFRRLIHNKAEIISASGTFAGDVFSHTVGLISPKPVLRQAPALTPCY